MRKANENTLIRKKDIVIVSLICGVLLTILSECLVLFTHKGDAQVVLILGVMGLCGGAFVTTIGWLSGKYHR